MFDTTQSVIEFLEAALNGDLHDYASQYGEPGYTQPEGKTPMVVLGSYWCRCDKIGEPYSDGTYLHGIEAHYPAAFRKLEEQGVEFEWYDEWMVDYHHDKAYRTTADSYSWKPSVILTDDCEWMTPDDDLETWIEFLANDPTKCLPDHIYDASDLIKAGFDEWGDGNYQNGWYEGQNDDPKTIFEQITTAYDEEEIEVVFVLDRTGQFDLAFSAYYRTAEERAEALASV